MNQIEPSDLTTTSLGELKPLALPAVGDHGDAAVDLGARHPAGQMLAGDEPALIVDGVAVRVVGALAEHRDFVRWLDVAHHAVVGDVGPDEIAPGGEPGRALAPARAGPQPLDAHMAGETGLESLIDDDDFRSLYSGRSTSCPSPVSILTGDRYEPGGFADKRARGS